MKKYFLFCSIAYLYVDAFAQTNNAMYPEPEYSNEVYLLKKDSNKVIRLEKGSSKMNTKTKLGGMGGMENGYSIEGAKSTIRLPSGNGLIFVFSTGVSPDKKKLSPNRFHDACQWFRSFNDKYGKYDGSF